MSPHNSQLVACGGEAVVASKHNATAAGDVVLAIVVAAADDVVVMVGAAAVVVVWVQRCLMRPCTSPQFSFASVAVTLTIKEPSWRDW